MRLALAGQAPWFIHRLSRASLRADHTLHWRSSYLLLRPWRSELFTGFDVLCLPLILHQPDRLPVCILH